MRAVLFLLFLSMTAQALDFEATPVTVWQRYVAAPVPEHLTASQLRTALEWQVFKGPLPNVSGATPYGIRLRRWDRVIARMGLPVVADEYVTFLRQLRAELARVKTQ